MFCLIVIPILTTAHTRVAPKGTEATCDVQAGANLQATGSEELVDRRKGGEGNGEGERGQEGRGEGRRGEEKRKETGHALAKKEAVPFFDTQDYVQIDDRRKQMN